MNPSPNLWISWDHPRSRGVYPGSAFAVSDTAGSSPLARGLLAYAQELKIEHGIIPARAGFTASTVASVAIMQDHPRSRGVYAASSYICIKLSGSSPLARGLLTTPEVKANIGGIIPARAGFTHSPGTSRRSRRDHPRSRGVYRRLRRIRRLRTGSSPLARGLREIYLRQSGRERIIPARAGFTPGHPTGCRPTSDHPRSRGVYVPVTVSWSVLIGSSPLARGLRADDGAQNAPVGIIPARAGFTPAGRLRPPCRPDHPRSRGVYSRVSSRSFLVCGSSPLARGLPSRRRGLPPPGGIIPARAGFTRSSRRSWGTRRDHPRSRGVYEESRPIDPRIPGSSPLARGLLPVGVPDADRLGIIPARAGFTMSMMTRSTWKRDHPRSRGVYSPLASPRTRWKGSSPLARGLRRPSRSGRRTASDHPRSRGVYLIPIKNRGTDIGIIPARAGFTADNPVKKW